ncbi:uncharacterized protein LOC122651211 [Telopea speciosissima]|uniref:uncharacterized protein LOC122651211 n=1 Tax=Telopea speciosissima TaxID=54955 RepID=UPI001CC7F3A3|nr:uncharacterized protein LOC122651211 [Telopea speciosissima]
MAPAVPHDEYSSGLKSSGRRTETMIVQNFFLVLDSGVIDHMVVGLIKDPKMGTTIFVLLMIYLVMIKCASSSEEGDRSSLFKKQEDYDLEDLELQPAKLLISNKPAAVKSIKTKNGDIYDCVDIKKQPAFDHPLLRNHTIQMKPSSFPVGLMVNKELLESKPSDTTGVKGKRCPPGTVLIQRTQKEEDITSMAKSQFATFQLGGLDRKYYGGYVHFGIDQPKVSSINQFSASVLWIENGPIHQLNSIQVGWTVNPRLFGDNKTRVFSYWTADGFHKTGCFNLLCPGFVQVSRKKTLGTVYDVISIYGGQQYEDDFLVYKDPNSGNWWYVTYLNGGHEAVGYWPSTLFTTLRDSASMITAGGEVYSPTSEGSPQMGKGVFPVRGDSRLAASARRLQFMDEKQLLLDPIASLLKIQTDNPACYKVELVNTPYEYWKNSILFGGPGGACGN